MLVRLGIALIIFGCLLGFYTYREGGLAVNALSDPERVALKDLIARGPNGNPHIILTGFDLGDNIVYSSKNDGKTWDEVWVPLHPDDAQEPPAGEAPKAGPVQALLYSKHCRNNDELQTRLAADELHGMVINKVKG